MFAPASRPAHVARWGVVALLLASVGLFVLGRISQRPVQRGLQDGRLAACPASPHCVCSEATDPAHRVDPLRFESTPPEAMARLKKIVDRESRVTVVTSTTGYLHARFQSRVFGFVDDVEFRLNSTNKLIHVRSGSRVGYSDFGVNRRRVERLRREFERAGAEP